MEQSRNGKASNDDGTRKEQGFNQTNGLPTPCLKCNKTFQTAEERVMHIKTSPLHICCETCETCEDIVEFEDFLGLYLHIKGYHPHLPATVEERRNNINSPPGFCCQKCDSVVRTRSTFSLGSERKTVCLWYCYTCDHHCKSRCRVCHECDFESDVHLRMHYQSRHPLEHCPVCDTIFGSVEEKVLHVRTSWGHHCCAQCEDVLDSRWKLEMHYQSRHPLVYCSACATIFNSVEERTTHIRTSLDHHCCQHCEEVLLTEELRMHNQSCHPQVYCFLCDTIFTSVEERTAHLRTSSKHYCCQHCEEVLDFTNEYDLHMHQRFGHPSLYCRTCRLLFPSVEKSFAHRQEVHHFCDGCHVYCYSALHLAIHRQVCEKLNPPKQKRPKPDPKTRMLRNHYVTLGISPKSSHEQVVKAAKEMRVKVHPDRWKRAGGLTEEQERAIDLEAKLVGQAADVLSDPALRRMYDLKL